MGSGRTEFVGDFADNDDPAEVATTLAKCISELMNLCAFLAAPRIRASAAEGAGRGVRAEMIDMIDRVERAWSKRGPRVWSSISLDNFVSVLPALRVEIAAWTGGEPGPALVALARDTVRTLQVPDPQGGWDAFDPDLKSGD
jgi:hypothetical protein